MPPRAQLVLALLVACTAIAIGHVLAVDGPLDSDDLPPLEPDPLVDADDPDGDAQLQAPLEPAGEGFEVGEIRSLESPPAGPVDNEEPL